MEYFILSYTKGATSESGESCKSSYNLEDSCDVCGTGAKLVGNLRTKGITKIKKDFFTTLDDDFIISKSLYEDLIKMKLRLGDLKRIVDYKNNELPFYHLNTVLYFPPAIKKDGLIIEDQCQVCKRNGFFNKAIIGDIKMNIPTHVFPVSLHYSMIDNKFLSLSDFFFTWECMGLSNLVAKVNNVVRYARPLLIVSKSFKSILEQNKIKGLEFEQIIIMIEK